MDKKVFVYSKDMDWKEWRDNLENPHFQNWGDLFLPRIAARVLPFVASINWITPNMVTIFSFFLYLLGCLFIFINIPYHLYFTAILLPIAYMGDCIDGDLARIKNLTSPLGNYIDKVVDVLKIYAISMSLAYGAYINTQNVIYIFLGFMACFFFNFRYYIKLETIYDQCNSNPNYLIQSREKRNILYQAKETDYSNLSNTISGKAKAFWLKNKIIFWVDEAEFVIFTSIAAVFNKIELVLWIFAVSQFLIAFWRLFERGYQTHKNPKKFLEPIRK